VLNYLFNCTGTVLVLSNTIMTGVFRLEREGKGRAFMQNRIDEQMLYLAPSQLVSMRLDEERTIRIEHGMVWITIEADVNDYWLSVGEALLLPPCKHIVIEAGRELGLIDMRPRRAMPVAI
jgi:hypothetical protein